MVVTNHFNPDPRVYKEAKSLVRNGYEVIIIAWDRVGKYPEKEVMDGVVIKRIKLKCKYGSMKDFIIRLPLFYLKALKILLKEKFNVIHTHDFDTAFLGFLSKYLFRKKWIYDVHDLYFTFFMKDGNNKKFIPSLLSNIVKKIDLFFAKCCGTLIIPTESIGGKFEGLKEYYIINRIKKDKIITIWNVPDVEGFLNYKKLDLKKSDKFTIGFIGSQRTTKNFISLFEAVKNKSDEYKILFVGEGKTTEQLKKIVKEKYHTLDVEFVGNVDYKLIPNYYKICDVIYSVYIEKEKAKNNENEKRAIQTKVFESSILGVPLIVPGYVLNNDYVERYMCGVSIEDINPEKLREALNKIKNIKVNSEKIIKDWNWKNEEKKLLKVYEGLK
jgi:glycosyltransferase involved in cell wall biosynthesis